MTEPRQATGQALKIRVVQAATPSLAGQEFEVVGPTVWLGRGHDNDVVLQDPGISRRHARIESPEPGRFVLYDNDSANGVLVDGKRIRQVELAPGQRFTLGSTVLELAGDPQEAAPAPAAPVAGQTMVISDFAEIAAQIEKPQPLEELGEVVELRGSRPFVASNPASVWLVETGKLEVFTVSLERGEPVGPREHFLTLDEGDVLFGLDVRELGVDAGFLAVPHAGAAVRRFDVERLPLYALAPHHRQRLTEMVSRWVASLSKRLAAARTKAPDPDLLLAPGAELELSPEAVAASMTEVLWIELPAAQYLFSGMAGISYAAEGVLLPLAPGASLELLASDEPVHLHPHRTAQVIDDPRLWAGLDTFHRAFMECEFLNKRLALIDEFDRLQRKAEHAEAAQEAGIGAIEAVLGGARKWERPFAAAADSGPVVQACQLVGEALGLEVVRPAQDLDELSFDETVQAVAAASRYRIRRVALVDDWWNRDQGPLLGQREEDGAAVALLPTGSRTYDSVDSRSGERQPVTDAVAGTLVPFAYSFYRRLPEGKVGAKALVRFAAGGLKREFREVLAMAAAVAVLSMVTPMITGMVFDTAIPQAERGMLVQLSIGLFLAAAGTAAFKITQSIAMVRVQSKMDYAGQAGIWDRLLDLPLTFFRNYTSGDLADRASAVDKIRSIVAGAGVAAILGTLGSFGNAVQMGFYSVRLALVAVALTLVYLALTVTCNVIKVRQQRKEMWQRGKLSGLVLQLISGVSKLRVAGAENHAFRVWATQFSEMRRTAFRVGRIENLMPTLNAGFQVVASMVIFLTVASMHREALEKGELLDLSTGDFLAFSAAFGIFLGAMQALGDASVYVLEVVPIFERVKPVLEEEAEVDSSRSAPGTLRGAIELAHVRFRYTEDGPWILQDINLEIEPGEFVAFVGGSGSGKSTLMKVMLGFERPQAGAIYYDGQDLATVDVRLLRQQLGVVLQQSRLLPVEIYRNIVGSSSRTVADAWEAARQAGLADDIKAMPMGMHTYVSEGGGGFSGGQKQRLMIARALVNKPRILYLDEATSALDNRTQAIVTESMDRLQATRIVIAHRLSTIINADKICYLEGGKIAEQGNYEELMALDGRFAALARRQIA